MKVLIAGVLLVLCTICTMGQKFINTELIDELLKENKTLFSTKQIIGGIIKQHLRNKPHAPKSLELEIQNALDYKGYIEKVRKIYRDSFTENEIKELISLHRLGNIELYKKKNDRVSKPLYSIGSEFGKDALKIINSKLQQY